MDRFAVWRQSLAVRTREHASGFHEPVPTRGDREGAPDSRFGAVIVLLIPVAAVVWVIIAWLVYRLLT